MTNEVLKSELRAFLKRERESVAGFLERLAEVDRRELYLVEGYSSLVAYCQKELRLSRSASLKRVMAARLSKRFPAVLELLADGRLHLSGLCLISRHLTEQNADTLLKEISGKSEDEIKRVIAGNFPKPEADLPPDAVTWFSKDAGGVFFVGPPEVIEDLYRARDLLKNKYPDGKFAAIIGEALKLLIGKKTPTFPAKSPRSTAVAVQTAPPAPAERRRIRRALQIATWQSDGGQCAYVSPGGKRCEERGGLQFDHIQPWALGGRSDDPKNVRLLCFRHNQYLARRVFGADHVKKRIEERKKPT